MGIISKSPTISHSSPGQAGMAGSSAAKTYNAAGSGSRPTSSRVKLPSSAPVNPKTLSRDVPGSLK